MNENGGKGKNIFLIGLILVLLITGCTFKKNKNIIMYELKTSHYFNLNQNKFFINSEEELNKFYSLFSNRLDISSQLNINKEYLKNNTIFIQVSEVNSGSISMKLKNVTFENSKVNFSVTKNIPEKGTQDMACWFLVAIIPNQKLQNIKFDGWIKPSSVNY